MDLESPRGWGFRLILFQLSKVIFSRADMVRATSSLSDLSGSRAWAWIVSGMEVGKSGEGLQDNTQHCSDSSTYISLSASHPP